MRCRVNRFAAEAGLAPCLEIRMELPGLAPRPETLSAGLSPTLELPAASQAEPAGLGSAPEREPELALRLLAHASLSTFADFPIDKALNACPKTCCQDPIPTNTQTRQKSRKKAAKS